MYLCAKNIVKAVNDKVKVTPEFIFYFFFLFRFKLYLIKIIIIIIKENVIDLRVMCLFFCLKKIRADRIILLFLLL